MQIQDLQASSFKFIYIFINYNTITNYILIIYRLSNLDHTLVVVSQTRVSDGNRTYDPLANSPALRKTLMLINSL